MEVITPPLTCSWTRRNIGQAWPAMNLGNLQGLGLAGLLCFTAYADLRPDGGQLVGGLKAPIGTPYVEAPDELVSSYSVL